MKILIVEDEAPTRNFLSLGLSEEGFAVDLAANGASAEEAVSASSYDAIVLDIMLPGTDGFTLCRRWRAAGIATPILFLTARDDVADRVKGLDLGGDDYLVKPFAFTELLARLRALIRRGASFAAVKNLRVGDLVIDTSRRQVSRGGRTITLSMREYQLLEYLARNAGKVVTRTELSEHIWGSPSEPDSNVVDVYVRYLRNKLGRRPDPIQTVRGGGYLLAAGHGSKAPGSESERPGS